MAKRTIFQLIDDIDNKPVEVDANGNTLGETIKFSIDGTEFEIDLSNKNAAKMREAFAPYLEKATRLGRVGIATSHRATTTSSYRRTNPDSKERNRVIRDWWKNDPAAAEVREQYPYTDRGRIRAEVVDAYDNRHANAIMAAAAKANEAPSAEPTPEKPTKATKPAAVPAAEFKVETATNGRGKRAAGSTKNTTRKAAAAAK